MKISEIIMTILFSSTMFLFFYVGSGKSVFVAILIAYSIYWFFSGIPIFLGGSYRKTLKEVNKNKNLEKYLVFSAFCGIIISFSLTIIIFKMNKWPLPNILIFAMFTIQIFIILLSTVFYIKTNNQFFTRVIIRMCILVLLFSFIFFLKKEF